MGAVDVSMDLLTTGISKLISATSEGTQSAVGPSFIQEMTAQAMQLIDIQMQAQTASQNITALTNIIKTDNETKIAAIRNFSVR